MTVVLGEKPWLPSRDHVTDPGGDPTGHIELRCCPIAGCEVVGLRRVIRNRERVLVRKSSPGAIDRDYGAVLIEDRDICRQGIDCCLQKLDSMPKAFVHSSVAKRSGGKGREHSNRCKTIVRISFDIRRALEVEDRRAAQDRLAHDGFWLRSRKIRIARKLHHRRATEDNARAAFGDMADPFVSMRSETAGFRY